MSSLAPAQDSAGACGGTGTDREVTIRRNPYCSSKPLHRGQRRKRTLLAVSHHTPRPWGKRFKSGREV
ncbi:hypothetical protein G6O67_005993 [Ophiocordyceps sinensis]|uniref:Uncharacterized protein n=1 Tax=Ophiocordyceps sinensis TaxID=72228 RepID=A0A8H4LXH6_9HYPO|nr:hypothetical protein G6O67_005993 [Ophiocordyceps sinensis]